MKKTDARKLPPEALEHIRRQAFVLRQKGCTWARIAEVCGVHVGTVLKWARRAQADTVETVIKGGQRGRQHGSGRTLTQAQEEHLRLQIIGSNPARLDLGFALWNRHAVILAIRQMFGISMSVRTAGEYLHRWGFTPQRPVRQMPEQNPLPLKTWLRTEYPGIAARARAEGAEICWVDKTAIRQNPHQTQGCAVADRALPTARQGSVLMISAITNQGLVRFLFFEGPLNTGHFIIFLDGLIQDARRKVFLIVSSLRVYRARQVVEWVAKNPGKIELFYLPPCKPEPGSDEYQDRHLKTAVRPESASRTATIRHQKT